MSNDLDALIRCQRKWLDEHVPFVTVTLLAIRGSAPQIVGAKALVADGELRCGTVGGGRIEAAVVEHAKALLNDPACSAECQSVTWNLQTDIGMTCGGEVTLLFETYVPRRWPIAVFGAGHIAQSLIPLLLTLDCNVTCTDSRPSWLDRLPEHRKLTTVCIDDLPGAVAHHPSGAFFLLMTQGHATDWPVLHEILSTRSAPYVGVIGSKLKAKKLRSELIANGIDQAVAGSFHCPMGLPIGNNTPPEIAISIAAQLLQHRQA